MSGDLTTDAFAPLVQGYYEEEQVWFIHTEASDPGVADMLTMMMGPEVWLVPELADAPPSMLARVYVFSNGVSGMGPFGFQPDVFDAVPGDAAYQPLRRVLLVEWSASEAREITSVAQIEAAEAAGEITVSEPGIVVNLPILKWPGGER